MTTTNGRCGKCFTYHDPDFCVKDQDAEINALFRRLDSMKGTAAEGGQEYMQTLYALRDKTRARVGNFSR